MFGPEWEDLNKTRRSMDAIDFWRYVLNSPEAQKSWLPFYEDGENLLAIWKDLIELLEVPNVSGGIHLDPNRAILDRMTKNLTKSLESHNAIEEMIPYLVQAYHEEWSLMVKEWIVDFIKATKSKNAVFYFFNFLKDPDDLVRYDAINSLGRLRDERAVPYLLESMYDPKDNVVGISVWSIADILGPRSIPIFKQKIEDPKSSYVLKQKAIDHMGNVGSVLEVPFLEKYREDPNLSGYVRDSIINIYRRDRQRRGVD